MQDSVQRNQTSAYKRMCLLVFLMSAAVLEPLRDHFGDACSYLALLYCYFLMITCLLVLAGSRLQEG